MMAILNTIPFQKSMPAMMKTTFQCLFAHVKWLALGLALCGPISAMAVPILVQDPPPQLAFLKTVATLRKDILFDLWEEGHFPPNREMGPLVHGKHWHMIGEIRGGKDLEGAWGVLKPAFLKNGWGSVKSYRQGGFLEVMHYAQGGVEAWTNIGVDANGTQFFLTLDVIEVMPAPFALTLAAPAGEPEAMNGDKGDFPYLAPLPGSRLHSGNTDAANTLLMMPPGATQPEIVATGTMTRLYDLPGLTNVLFGSVYHDALVKAGWTIVKEQGGLIQAHYALKGRNIWAYLLNNNDGYSITIGDVGSRLNGDLAANCHVALYGVLFDFNKSTLQPISDAALQPVANLLATRPLLTLEVQGHTDNVGNDAYNQTLSEARARAVIAWLTQHGVAANRLTARGYGRTLPVADNGNEGGRAKNRRVEILDPKCVRAAK